MKLARISLFLGGGLAVAATALAAPPDAAPAPAGHVVPPDLDDVEHMCALLTGCGDKLPFPPDLVPHDLPACVRALGQELASASAVAFSLTLRECGLRASSCGQLRACALRGAKADACAGRGHGGSAEFCDSDGRAITCTNERITAVRDCPRGGEQCAVRDGKAFCALGPCPTDGPAACSPSGTRVLECKKGKLTSFDCGAFGLRCVSTPDGPKCATQGAACTEGATRCEGSSAVACLHGHEVKVDCGQAGLTCGASGSRGASTIGVCATPAHDGGTCETKTAKCNGASIEYCAFGAKRSYLCKSVGLSRCIADDKGARCGG